MIKILSSQQIKLADQYTIDTEPISSLLLMERAATRCFNWLTEKFDNTIHFKIFCGPGNNGGDGLAIARMLHHAGFKVTVFAVRNSLKYSNDFLSNEKRLIEIDTDFIKSILTKDDLPEIENTDVVIDCIFGTGLNKPPEGIAAAVIQHINAGTATTIAIDLPSGLFADVSSVTHKNAIVNAQYTLTFQLPKLAFMFPENAKHVGEVEILDIKLDSDFIQNQPTNYLIHQQLDIAEILQPRKAFSHKGTYGHALILAGSYGKMGAAVLASKACLRSGAGLVTAQIPKCGYAIFQSSIHEAMCIPDSNENFISTVTDYGIYDAIGVGPGIGKEEQTQKLLKQLIQNYNKPIVFDADAINILAENKTWLSFLPAGCIFTPHVREFERLVGKSSDDFERNKMQMEFAMKYNCYLILKGKNTCIATPKGRCFFNTTGNPGMATGGTGDVLTGIITGILAQGYSPLEASLAGVYLHGLAGDLALKYQSPESLIASDVIENLGQAFMKLNGK